MPTTNMTTRDGKQVCSTDHQWVLAAGPWPQHVPVNKIMSGKNPAIVDTKCRYCRKYKEHTLYCHGEWSPNKINAAMERSQIFWK
jgi:hypothetical protein